MCHTLKRDVSVFSQCSDFTKLERMLVLLEEHAKEKVSILKGAQSTNVCSTNRGKKKSLGQVKECSHENMNAIGR